MALFGEERDVYDQSFDGGECHICEAAPDRQEGVLRRVYDIASSVARSQFRFNRFDAEEIGQEMSLRAYQRLHVASINVAWVSRGTHYLCIDLIRTRNSEARALELLGRSPRRPSSFTPDFELANAIAALPADSQELLVMHFWEGRTWAEMDERLGQGRRCAQYRTRKSLEALALALGRDGTPGREGR